MSFKGSSNTLTPKFVGRDLGFRRLTNALAGLSRDAELFADGSDGGILCFGDAVVNVSHQIQVAQEVRPEDGFVELRKVQALEAVQRRCACQFPGVGRPVPLGDEVLNEGGFTVVKAIGFGEVLEATDVGHRVLLGRRGNGVRAQNGLHEKRISRP